jgi:hypothetical protein
MDFADGSAVRLTVARYTPQADQFKSRIQMAMKSILKNQNLVLKRRAI